MITKDHPWVTSYELLGVRVHALTIADLHSAISDAVVHDRRVVIAHHNLHSIYLHHRLPEMRVFFERAAWVHIDGMPLVYWGRILGHRLRREHRVTYVDWTGPLLAEVSSNSWRVFYLGSKPGVAERGIEVLRARFPGLQIIARDGYFDATPGSNENCLILEEISGFRPHILMVGMGMPRQELWVLDNLEKISANAILTCGAAVDYIAGVVPTPPRWMGRLGLEWLYRLVSEPRRLASRYLLEPWALSRWLARDLRRKIKE